MVHITFIGARGGVGTSTLALEVARQLSAGGQSVQIIDSDPWQEIVPDAPEFQGATSEVTLLITPRHLPCAETDRIVLLVPAEVRAIATAAQILPELERHALVYLVVRTPGPTPIKPEKISQLLQIPLAAVIKSDSKIALLGEHGARTTRGFRESVNQLIRSLDIE